MHGRDNYNRPRSLSFSKIITVRLYNFIQQVELQLGLQDLYIKVHVLGHSSTFLYLGFDRLSFVSEVDDLIAQLQDFEEASLLTLEYVDTAVDSFLIH